MTPGAGTGEFARLVPRDPTDAGGGDSPENNPGVSERKRSAEPAGAKEPQKQQHHQQQQALEDLVPPAGQKSLPGAGVSFVVDSDEIVEGSGGGGGGSNAGSGGRVGGAGRALSVFEAKALQKARTRQKDRMEAGEPQVQRNVLTGGGRASRREGWQFTRRYCRRLLLSSPFLSQRI